MQYGKLCQIIQNLTLNVRCVINSIVENKTELLHREENSQNEDERKRAKKHEGRKRMREKMKKQ